MLTKFLIAKSGGRSGCGVLQSYLRGRPRVSALDEQFNLSDKCYQNPQNWLKEIQNIYEYSHPGKRARGCILKANDPTMPQWVELRRQISITVPDLRLIFLTRNYVSQYAASVAAMLGTDAQLPVRVDIDHMLGMFKLWDIASSKLRQIFQHHSSLCIRYEDLIHHPRRTVNLVFEFLGLGADPFQTLSESDTSPAEIIANIEEVQQALRDTAWASFCDLSH